MSLITLLLLAAVGFFIIHIVNRSVQDHRDEALRPGQRTNNPTSDLPARRALPSSRRGPHVPLDDQPEHVIRAVARDVFGPDVR